MMGKEEACSHVPAKVLRAIGGEGWSLPCFYPLRVSYIEAAC